MFYLPFTCLQSIVAYSYGLEVFAYCYSFVSEKYLLLIETFKHLQLEANSMLYNLDTEASNLDNMVKNCL